MKTLILEQRTFWDKSIEKIDLIRDKNYVIHRILTRGSDAEFFELFKYYTKEDIRIAISGKNRVSKKMINYLNKIIKINTTNIQPCDYTENL